MENEKEVWAGYVGGLILIIIFGTLALVAAGGWSWFAKFLENSAPAWVQAFGSVFAIFAAVHVSNKQHTRQLLKDEIAANLINKHRNDILYFAIESIRQTSAYIEKSIMENNHKLLLDQYKIMYLESSRGLSQFPILEIRNPELALATMELNQLLVMNKETFSLGNTAIKNGLTHVIQRCVKMQTTFWSQKNTQSDGGFKHEVRGA